MRGNRPFTKGCSKCTWNAPWSQIIALTWGLPSFGLLEFVNIYLMEWEGAEEETASLTDSCMWLRARVISLCYTKWLFYLPPFFNQFLQADKPCSCRQKLHSAHTAHCQPLTPYIALGKNCSGRIHQHHRTHPHCWSKKNLGLYWETGWHGLERWDCC